MGSLNFVRLGGDVLVRFSDINDAVNSYNHIMSTHLEWSVDFITPATFAEVRLALETFPARSSCLSCAEN